MIEFTLNNYQTGAKLRSAPSDKIVRKERIDKTHVVVAFDNVTENEIQFMEKLFAKKATRK